MVIPRNNVQKESTYGWYPSKVNVYENSRAKHGYDKECLFKFWESMYHHNNPQGISMVTPPPGVKSPSIQQRIHSSSSSSRKKYGAYTPKRPETEVGACMRFEPVKKLAARAQSVPVEYEQDPPSHIIFRYQEPQITSPIPTPKIAKKYHGWRPQSTIIGVVDPDRPYGIESTPRASEKVSVNMSPLIKEYRSQTPAQKISGSVHRAQSASIHREKATPARSIKSANMRSSVPSTVKVPEAHMIINSMVQSDKEQQKKSGVDSYFKQIESELKESTSPREDAEEMERCGSPAEMASPSPTFEQQLDKYGWRAEVPGDPYNIKPIPKRLPYTVKCKEPHVKENPFSVRVRDNNTFFTNTIPRHPMTFAVHPEWHSEIFVTKRKELQKKGRVFHTRNFGFVY